MEAKLVHLQHRHRHVLRHDFSRAIASRFYIDGSLERRHRLLECTRRRTERAQERARVERCKAALLQRAYEEMTEMEDKKRDREAKRAERRLHHLSAQVIQSAWRRVYHERLWLRLHENAAYLIQITFKDYLQKQKQKRFRAHRQLQRWWRSMRSIRQQVKAVCCLQRWFRFEKMKQRQALLNRQISAAKVLQHQWRVYWLSIQYAASIVIQRWLRQKRRRQQFKRLASIYQHLQSLERMTKSAQRIQYAVGRHAVQKRIYIDAAFSAKLIKLQSTEAILDRTEEATLSVKNSRLKQQVHTLEKEVKQLRTEALSNAQTRRNEEKESLRRLQILEAQRLVIEVEKANAIKLLKEKQTRRDIRFDIEKQLDFKRRAVKNDKKTLATPLVHDKRIELA
ncbi:hypothetical protein THRCLA_23406 [Thraustotheca clavata]|uniref:Uncharacterized protein n=1 Tax=Thraustotheca clavata TaxID=74557 RepID=A0A1V9Y6D0_9STRA|nr:hypothetical protein THRCLA_23406 [Thraustotheca clavata]